MKEKNDGITLIALIITIIVLLILAGAAVSIGLSGDNVFEKANEAKESWNEKTVQEETDLKTALKYIGTKIPDELEVGDTVNWTPSGHYTWDVNYYASGKWMDFFVTKELYSGEEVPNDAINEWPHENASSNNINMTISNWKVLKIDRDNSTVVLIAAQPTNAKLVLSDTQGYNNGVKLLNDACSNLYGKYAGVKAKSINLTDIINLMNPNQKEQIIEERKNLGNIKYGEKKAEPYTTNKLYPVIFEEEQPDSITPGTGYSGKILGGEESKDTFIQRQNNKKEAGTSINPIRTNLSFTYENLINALGEYASLLLSGIEIESNVTGYWLASRQVYLDEEYCGFLIGQVAGYGTQGSLWALDSAGATKGNERSIFPIVEITKGDIKKETGGTYIYEPYK